ncbi:MAG TPA: hypothetical protein VFX58_15180 [Chitinophagaceae bacterium]|nr:hypothetical protein [Chitinophagaceae bacterium]
MEMRFVKTIQFTRLIKAGGRLREFNFRKINNTESELFTVNVCDDRGERILFYMLKEQNDWRLGSQQLPAWIGQQEDQLNIAIEDELKSSNYSSNYYN